MDIVCSQSGKSRLDQSHQIITQSPSDHMVGNSTSTFLPAEGHTSVPLLLFIRRVQPCRPHGDSAGPLVLNVDRGRGRVLTGFWLPRRLRNPDLPAATCLAWWVNMCLCLSSILLDFFTALIRWWLREDDLFKRTGGLNNSEPGWGGGWFKTSAQ